MCRWLHSVKGTHNCCRSSSQNGRELHSWTTYSLSLVGAKR
jgi:hypothetical protein